MFQGIAALPALRPSRSLRGFYWESSGRDTPKGLSSSCTRDIYGVCLLQWLAGGGPANPTLAVS